VVWFGESLPSDVLSTADAYINDVESIDIVIVIGTSARVWPAAGYIDEVLLSRQR
jgi:NAD-dependent SIR2 family protein deacetylase